MALEVTPLAVIGAVVASLGTLGVAVIVLYLVGGRTRKVSSTDKLVLVWLIYNAFTHFVLVSRKRGRGRYLTYKQVACQFVFMLLANNVLHLRTNLAGLYAYACADLSENSMDLNESLLPVYS